MNLIKFPPAECFSPASLASVREWARLAASGGLPVVLDRDAPIGDDVIMVCLEGDDAPAALLSQDGSDVTVGILGSNAGSYRFCALRSALVFLEAVLLSRQATRAGSVRPTSRRIAALLPVETLA